MRLGVWERENLDLIFSDSWSCENRVKSWFKPWPPPSARGNGNPSAALFLSFSQSRLGFYTGVRRPLEEKGLCAAHFWCFHVRGGSSAPLCSDRVHSPKVLPDRLLSARSVACEAAGACRPRSAACEAVRACSLAAEALVKGCHRPPMKNPHWKLFQAIK